MSDVPEFLRLSYAEIHRRLYDPSVPVGERLHAVKIVCDWKCHHEPHPDDPPPMTHDELQEAIEKVRAEIERR